MCMYPHIYIYICILIYLFIYLFIYIFIYLHMYIMYIHVYTHTHIYIYIYIYSICIDLSMPNEVSISHCRANPRAMQVMAEQLTRLERRVRSLEAGCAMGVPPNGRFF